MPREADSIWRWKRAGSVAGTREKWIGGGNWGNGREGAEARATISFITGLIIGPFLASEQKTGLTAFNRRQSMPVCSESSISAMHTQPQRKSGAGSERQPRHKPTWYSVSRYIPTVPLEQPNLGGRPAAVPPHPSSTACSAIRISPLLWPVACEGACVDAGL